MDASAPAAEAEAGWVQACNTRVLDDSVRVEVPEQVGREGGQFVDDACVRLFRREAETLARLEHPNIAAIHESGRTEDGQHFFAMSWFGAPP